MLSEMLRPERRAHPRRIALVLGGGGLKGFAHIGVLRALEERGVRPSVIAGTSIGALMGAAYACGMPVPEMGERARRFRKADLFRLNHLGMLVDRMRSRAIYMDAPLRASVESVVADRRFDELETRLLVNTVDLRRGTTVVWGLPGLRDVSIRDAVYASCALPGYFPPGQVDGRLCVDGGVVDNLPVAIAALGCDAVIAVDVGNSDLTHGGDVEDQGFAAIYMRAATVMMHALQLQPLAQWSGPPMILIRPRVTHLGWFSFGHTAEIIEEGYRSAVIALEHLDECLAAPGGIFPRRNVRISVNRDLCTGCGICAALAPQLMGLDSQRKAFARAAVVPWSPADGDFVSHCPTRAIDVIEDSVPERRLAASGD
ncbi:MAG TPA: patatin-like phospholipase family protein [Gemmatimonadaceae bacterium]|nr:patatin-like phospholipase family protein [Gemmatimonadaceae bacterium]